MDPTARDKLTADFQAKKAAGLKDMKFFLGNVAESTVEEVCAEVNKLHAEVAKGNAKTLKSWGDSQRPKAKA
jgi:hypothetical protein